MEQKQLSGSTMLGQWQQRFPDFAPHEVLSPQGIMAWDKGIVVVSLDAMEFLQKFRDFVGHKIIVNHEKHVHRGYRSFAENVQVGGESFSYHMQGVAFDLTCPDISLLDFMGRAVRFGWHGVGLYPKRNFIHCDLRPLLKTEPTIWEKHD